MWRVVTDLAILGFDDETREMKVLALQPGRDARAGAGQHRLQAAVRRRRSRPPSRRARRSSPSCASSIPSGSIRRDVRHRQLRTARVERGATRRRSKSVRLTPAQARDDRFEGDNYGQEEADRVRHRHAQLHQVSGDAERAGADRLRRAHGGAGLRVRSGRGTTSCWASIPTSRSTRR